MRTMEYTEPTFHSPTWDANPSGAFEVLTTFGELVSDAPGALEQGLRRMARGLKENLSLRALAVKATTLSGELSITEGEIDGGSAVEFPIIRGKMLLGTISAYLDEPERLGEVRASALRAAAAVTSLAISVADASESLARQAAQGSVVKLASEALGTILDENQLYRTVLMLTLELLNSSAGVVLLENDGTASGSRTRRRGSRRSGG